MSNYCENNIYDIFPDFFLEDDLFDLEERKQINIMENFVFDESENNIIIKEDDLSKKLKRNESENNNQIKVNYYICSFLSSPIRPDLYCPLGIIKGNDYKLILIKEKNEEEKENEKETKKEDEDILSISIDSVEEEKIIENKKAKIIRYFNIEDDISKKCSICGEIGHTYKNCLFSNIKFCHRCIHYGHDTKECDNKKCFKCNREGHKTNKCNIDEDKLIICERCNCVGHKKEDCLLNPLEYNKSELIYNNLPCFICGNYEHTLCSIVGRELPMILTEENIIINNNIAYSFINLDEEENFQNINFCSYCGDNHTNENCIIKDKFKNKYDDIRKNAGKKILEKRNKKREHMPLLVQNKVENNNFNYNKIISLDEDDSIDAEDNYIDILVQADLNKKKKKKNKNKKKKKLSYSKDNENEEKNRQSERKNHNFRVLY